MDQIIAKELKQNPFVSDNQMSKILLDKYNYRTPTPMSNRWKHIENIKREKQNNRFVYWYDGYENITGQFDLKPQNEIDMNNINAKDELELKCGAKLTVKKIIKKQANYFFVEFVDFLTVSYEKSGKTFKAGLKELEIVKHNKAEFDFADLKKGMAFIDLYGETGHYVCDNPYDNNCVLLSFSLYDFSLYNKEKLTRTPQHDKDWSNV